MRYPATPKNAKEAALYAKELEKIHGGKFIPVRRVVPINSKFAINFSAISEKEIEDYSPDFEEI